MVKPLTRPFVANKGKFSFSKLVSCVQLPETRREKRGKKERREALGVKTCLCQFKQKH